MELKLRPWRETDIPDIVRYWTTLSGDDAERMGCDLPRFPSAEEYDRLLREQHATPLQDTVSFYSMWISDGQTIGFASLKNIEFGIRGEMHLHMWDAGRRGRGIGGRLFCLSALDFYERFQVRSIVCEPSAGNILPNRMLQKIGFPLAGSRYGRSSELSKELY